MVSRSPYVHHSPSHITNNYSIAHTQAHPTNTCHSQADKLQSLITAAKVPDVEPIWTTLFAKALEGKDVKSLLMNVGSGGGAAAAPAAGGAAAAGGAGDAAAEEEKPADKEEEKEESDEDMGFGLFD